MTFGILALEAAGHITAGDGRLMMLQGVDLDTARQVCYMLAIATNGRVQARYLGFPLAQYIDIGPEDVPLAIHT